MRLLLFCQVLALFGLPAGVLRAQSELYVWTTIAGSVGNAGSADGTNSQARFSSPSGIAVDGAGNLYVADILNNTIRKVAPVGTNWAVTTIAGLAGVFGGADGTNSDARFYKPNGVAVDNGGKLFVADHYNHTIREVTPVGTNWVVKTLAGLAEVHGSADGTNSEARFWTPTGIEVDSNGDLYVTDTANYTLRGLTAQGTNWVVSTLAGTPLDFGYRDATNESAEFNTSYFLAMNAQGYLYLADYGNHAIREIRHVGTDWVVGSVAGMSGAMGSTDGPGGLAKFNFPTGIGVNRTDPASMLFVADQSNNTIRRIVPGTNGWVVSTVGGVALQAGSLDATGTAARFRKPFGVTVDHAGNLYVTDWLNQTIRKGTPVGPIPRLAVFRSFSAIVVSWPAWASDYGLEAATALSPGAAWSPLTNGIVQSGAAFFRTNSLDAAGGFYRLRKQ